MGMFIPLMVLMVIQAYEYVKLIIPLVPSLHGKWMGKQWKQWLTLFFWAPMSLQMVIAAMKLKDAYSLEGKLCPT